MCYGNCVVTSLAEVWIEIGIYTKMKKRSMSLPLRKCGLKFLKCTGDIVPSPSLPLRKCGLKYAVDISTI